MNLSLDQVFVAIVLIGLLMMLGEYLRRKVDLFRSLFLPASIIAGAIALLLGPEVLGAVVVWATGNPDTPLAGGVWPDHTVSAWRAMPGLLISVVFAGLFLGKPLPGLRDIWYKAGPQVVFGQTVAWGQYVVGLLLVILVLAPLFGTPFLAGALIEIGFEGGHGTAAGLRGQFQDLGWEEGYHLAVGMATIGIVMGVVIGTVLINWAARSGRIEIADAAEQKETALRDLGKIGAASAEPAEAEMENQPTDPFSLHLGIVGLAVAIGWVMLQLLVLAEQGMLQALAAAGLIDQDVADQARLIGYVPLFPMAMIGGVIVQALLERTGASRLVSRRLMNRISGSALDFTIVAALAIISLSVLGHNLAPLLLLALAGAAWCVFAVVVLAPRLIPTGWFERGTGDFGQSMGVTPTGLLLMRMSDPANKSGALESFGYKQLMFEPIVGGGLFTALSMPLIAAWGPWWVLLLTFAVMCFFLIFGLAAFGRRSAAARRAERALRAAKRKGQN